MSKRLYTYTIDNLATGFVLAKNDKKALKKVKAAYVAHNDEFDEARDSIKILGFDDCSWFKDHPDVFEMVDQGIKADQGSSWTLGLIRDKAN